MERCAVEALGETCVGEGGGGIKVTGRVAGRSSSAGRACCTGARKALKGVPALKGSVGRVRRKGAIGDKVVQLCKDSNALTQHMSVTLRDFVPSAVVKLMSAASKSKTETMIGRLTKQLQMERTGQANAEVQLENERKRVGELEPENEIIKKQPVESNTKNAEAKQ